MAFSPSPPSTAEPCLDLAFVVFSVLGDLVEAFAFGVPTLGDLVAFGAAAFDEVVGLAFPFGIGFSGSDSESVNCVTGGKIREGADMMEVGRVMRAQLV